jgi:hypothetical protein
MTANFHKPIRQPPPFCLVTLKLSVHKTIGVSPFMNLSKTETDNHKESFERNTAGKIYCEVYFTFV